MNPESSTTQHAAEERLPPGKVAIVVVTHKECYPLDRCIEHHRELLQSPADLIFVDNGSGGVMTSWVRERFDDITIITRQINGFFCGGYNSGMQYAIDHDYEHVLIVNADTDIANPNYVHQLTQAADRHANTAFFGPRVSLREAGNTQNTILTYPWFFRYLRHWLAGRFAGHVNRSAAAVGDTDVEFLNGVCVLCRVAALCEIGLLDEVMGGYVEDADWSWRARKQGWKSMFVPVDSIIHHQASDEYEHHSLKTFMLRRNTVYWHMKESRRLQARLFATFSLTLARLRKIRAQFKAQDVGEHQQYVSRFQNVVRRILKRETIGNWFGPPVGKW